MLERSKRVLSGFLNEEMDAEERMEIVLVFQTVGAAELRARPPVSLRVLTWCRRDFGVMCEEVEAGH